jgi:hypothetical protein
MPTTPHVQTRSRTRLIAAASGLLAVAVAAGAAPPPASARSVDAPLYDGVNRFEVAVPAVSGLRPPIIRYRTIPADVKCRLTRLSYVAIADEPRERPAGRAALTVRCGNIPAGARLRLDPRRPLVRSVAIRNGDGRLDVRLDKPPGSVSPQVLLETTPRGRGSCWALSLHHRETRTLLTIRGRFRCRRLPRNARAVLHVGGVVAASPASEDAAGGRAPSHARTSGGAFTAAGGRAPSNARARRASVPPGDCGSVVRRPKSDTELEMSQTICVKPTEIVTIAPYSLGLAAPAETSCGAGGWITNANPWPGFTYEVTPTDGWWQAGKGAFGEWTFNNSSPDVSRKLVLTWTCWRAAPGNTALPTITGDAKVGGTLHCNPGTWTNPYVAGFDYQWVERRASGGTNAIALGDDTYTLTPAEVRKSVACYVSPYTAYGISLQPGVYSLTTDPVVDAPPRPLYPPTITWPELEGRDVGTMATCQPGTWDQARPKNPFTYEWWIADRDVAGYGNPIRGETGQQIRIPDRVGDDLSCVVTAHNVLGTVAVRSNLITILRGNRVL